VIASTVALHNGCPGGASWGRAWWTTREPTLLRYLAYILSQARHLPLLGSSPEALSEWRRGGENGESRATPRFLPVPPARTGRKGRKPSSAFVQVGGTYGLGA